MLLTAPPTRIRRGFTLIELLTVIAIIGILAAIIIPTVSKVRATARNAQCTAQLRDWGRVITMYSLDNKGNYYSINWASQSDADAPNGRSYQPYFNSLKSKDEAYRMRYCPADPDIGKLLGTKDDPRYAMVWGSVNGTQPVEKTTLPAAIPLSRARSLSQYVLMMDSVKNSNVRLTGNTLADLQTYIAPLVTPTYADRHGTKFNAVFGDGSVKRVTWNTTPGDVASVFSMRAVWFQLY